MKTEKASFETYLKQQGFTKSSIKTRLAVIGCYFEWIEKQGLQVEEITYNDLLIYIKHSQRKGVSQRTVQNYLGTIKHYYDHLIREARLPDGQGKTTLNPAEDIKVKGVKRKTLYHIFEPHDLHQLYNSYNPEASGESPTGKRNKVMLGLLIYQGLKTEELAKLETTDIKLREGKIEVPGGRRSNHRTMNLESHQVLEMYDYILQARPEILRASGEETNKLFISLTGKESTISNLTNSFLRPLKAKHTQLKNAKQIRASVITKWLKQYNLRETQYMAGHRYISTTEGYKQNDMEGLSEEVNMFHPLGQ
jgi:integrase/recombinase XerD